MERDAEQRNPDAAAASSFLPARRTPACKEEFPFLAPASRGPEITDGRQRRGPDSQGPAASFVFGCVCF